MHTETLSEICGEAYRAVDIMAQALAYRGYNWGGKLLCEIDEASPIDDDDTMFYVYDEHDPAEVCPLPEKE